STFGWPEKTNDIETFFPTTTLVTAYDIIFFWVSRMIMASLEFTGNVPFHDIYIHGLVRDKQGRKMSKSLGNGIDPLEIISMYGSDAFKFTLGFMCAQGQDVLIDKDSFKLGSRFANKVWNATRYILGNLEGITLVPVSDNDLTELDKWIYSELDLCARNEKDALENYRYNDAASSLYEYFWNEYCDWYVEATKLSFKNGDENEKNRAASVLLNILEENMRLLHPFIPFVTEEIYSKLPLSEIVKNRERAGRNSIVSNSTYSGMLIAAPFPEPNDKRKNEKVTERFNILRELIKNIRALRAECGIDPATKINISVVIESGTNAEVIKEKEDVVKLLAGISGIDFINQEENQKTENAIGTVGKGFEAFLSLDENINKEQLRLRFQKEMEEASMIAERARSKLSGKFAEHAAKELVDAERTKLEENERRAKKLASYIAGL
ncbi:MAG: class I tRNA ligase family protein, partial [Treponema sp.]|nr:class I tRNA ligase family protein [Treponema sp.]